MAAIDHPVTESRLKPANIEFMLMNILRLPELFNTAKAKLSPRHFMKDSEGHFRIIWETALYLEKDRKLAFMCDANNVQSTLSTFHRILSERLVDEPEAIPDIVQKARLVNLDPDKPGLLFRIYSAPLHVLDKDAALEYLQQFLIERTVFDPLRRLITNAGECPLLDIPAICEEYRDKALAVRGVAVDPVQSAAPTDWVPPKMNKFSTGVPWIDSFLGGGSAGGETYGVLGAYGSGKTTLAGMLLSKGAERQRYDADQLTKQTGVKYYPKECYLFTYEATANEMRIRLLAEVCSIDHQVLEEYDVDKLSSIVGGFESLKPYEKDQVYPNGWSEGTVLGEKERLDKFKVLLQPNCWIIDMSGDPDNPGLGSGGITEIRTCIENHLRKLEADDRKYEDEQRAQGITPEVRPPRQVGSVIIDYAGLACKRYMSAHSIPMDQLRHQIGGYANTCKREVALRFDCPVWIFHQLSGEANQRSHQARQHYSDAAEAKNFAENVVYSFELGTRDAKEGHIVFSVSKARRSALMTPAILLLQGRFYRLVPSDTHVYDPVSRQVVTKDIIDKQVTQAGVKAARQFGSMPAKYVDPAKMSTTFK